MISKTLGLDYPVFLGQSLTEERISTNGSHQDNRASYTFATVYIPSLSIPRENCIVFYQPTNERGQDAYGYGLRRAKKYLLLHEVPDHCTLILTGPLEFDLAVIDVFRPGRILMVEDGRYLPIKRQLQEVRV